MKRPRRKRLEDWYMDIIHKTSNSVKFILDQVDCPCDHEQTENCKKFNALYPEFCDPMKERINELIKPNENNK